MRRSASRRSRTLLLNARPPAMESPPDADCPPRRPAHRAIEPSPGPPCRQGTRGDLLPLLVALVLRGHEAELAREPVHDEVVAGGVDSAPRERGGEEKETQHERPSGTHPMRPFWRRHTSSVAIACSQLRPSKFRTRSAPRSTSSRQRTFTSI